MERKKRGKIRRCILKRKRFSFLSIFLHPSILIIHYQPSSFIYSHPSIVIHLHSHHPHSLLITSYHPYSSIFLIHPSSQSSITFIHLHPPHSAGAGGCSEGPSGGQSECVGGVEAADPTQRSHHQVHRARTTPRSAGREGGRCKGGQGGCY